MVNKVTVIEFELDDRVGDSTLPVLEST